MSLSFGTLKRLSFTHSAIYLTLLTVWLVPGLKGGEMVFAGSVRLGPLNGAGRPRLRLGESGLRPHDRERRLPAAVTDARASPK